MPPLITYIFEHKVKTNIIIVIKAYNYDEAINKLEETAKNPKEFINQP